MARIAYFYREMSEYIDIDLRLLRERHEVEVLGCPSRWPRPVSTWRAVRRADAVMSWFASWHAFLPALFARVQGKPFLVVVGGYDTACLPGIAYGHQRGGLKSAIARMVLSLASVRIGISEFTMSELAALGFGAAGDPLVPLGLDPERYACASAREPGLVVTVGGVYRSNLARKGLEAFVRAAALCPDQRFVLVGPWRDDAIESLRAIATANLTFTGELAHADKVAWLSRAQVIVQASQHEAFGLALAEGMLCGAVPVVTRAGALPWVAGGTGVVVESQDPAALAAGVRAALALPPASGAAARERVLAEFTVQTRAERLASVLAGLGIDAVPSVAGGGARRAA
jgi:glycosyltransferase involved in cell wall biosynthesis